MGRGAREDSGEKEGREKKNMKQDKMEIKEGEVGCRKGKEMGKKEKLSYIVYRH